MELRAQLDTTAERLAAAEAQTRALRSRSADQQGAAAAASASDRTQTMPGPRTAAAGGRETAAASRFGRAPEDEQRPRSARRPAERTARRADTEPDPPSAPLGERISEWMSSLTGSRSEPQNGHAAEPQAVVDGPPTAARTDRPRVPRTTEAGTAARTRRADRRTTVEKESPSWILRAAAVGLLALLMLALVVIVLSVL